VYESPNVDRVIAAWPHQPAPERIAELTQRRNERLAALAAHKASQTSFRGVAAATNPESRDSGFTRRRVPRNDGGCRHVSVAE